MEFNDTTHAGQHRRRCGEEHSVVTRSGRLQAVECLGSYHHRSVISDRSFRGANVVVDRLGNADELDTALFCKSPQNRETSIPTNADEGVDSELPHALYY